MSKSQALMRGRATDKQTGARHVYFFHEWKDKAWKEIFQPRTNDKESA